MRDKRLTGMLVLFWLAGFGAGASDLTAVAGKIMYWTFGGLTVWVASHICKYLGPLIGPGASTSNEETPTPEPTEAEGQFLL